VYKRILVAVEHSDTDRAILEHVTELARLAGSSILLVHVADGWVARHYADLNLRESEEMREDRAYLARVEASLKAHGLDVTSRLAMGDPATEIANVADQEQVDLIAMSTHGHRFIKDVLLGATADRLRHMVKVPVLLLRAT
jgi:nucleotide-binding universal stress UspA family protein